MKWWEGWDQDEKILKNIWRNVSTHKFLLDLEISFHRGPRVFVKLKEWYSEFWWDEPIHQSNKPTEPFHNQVHSPLPTHHQTLNYSAFTSREKKPRQLIIIRRRRRETEGNQSKEANQLQRTLSPYWSVLMNFVKSIKMWINKRERAERRIHNKRARRDCFGEEESICFFLLPDE